MSTQEPMTLVQLAKKIDTLSLNIDALPDTIIEARGEKRKHRDTFGTLIQSMELAQKAGAALLAIVGILYAMGFIVVNTSLSRFGIRDFSLLKATYLASALSYVLYSALALIMPAVLTLYVGSELCRTWRTGMGAGNTYQFLEFHKKFPSLSHVFMVLSLVIGSGILTVPLLVLAYLGIPLLTSPALISLGQVHVNFVLTRLFPWAMMLIVPTVGFLWWLAWRDYALHWADLLTALPFGVVVFLLATVLFGQLVYPTLPACLGGSVPVSIQFIADKTHKPMLDELIKMETEHKTIPVKLLDQTDKTYFVLVPEESGLGEYAVEIDKSLVKGIIHINAMPMQKPAPASK